MSRHAPAQAPRALRCGRQPRPRGPLRRCAPRASASASSRAKLRRPIACSSSFASTSCRRLRSAAMFHSPGSMTARTTNCSVSPSGSLAHVLLDRGRHAQHADVGDEIRRRAERELRPLDRLHAKAALLEQRRNALAGEEAHVRVVEDPQLAIRHRAAHHREPDRGVREVGDRRDDDAAVGEQRPRLLQQVPRVADVLQHVGVHDGVEAPPREEVGERRASPGRRPAWPRSDAAARAIAPGLMSAPQTRSPRAVRYDASSPEPQPRSSTREPGGISAYAFA